jgi:hypothetical protein
MKIISIDTSDTKGIRSPDGEEILWEPQEEDVDSYYSSFLEGVIPYGYPDDTEYCSDVFASAWLKFYEDNSEEIEEECLDTEEVLEKFDGPYIALEVTTHGMACGPVSFTVYFIIDQIYENQLDSMLIMDEA